MAPNFLSKFVKSSSPSGSDHHRSRTSSSSRSSFNIASKPTIALSPAPPGNKPASAPSGYDSSDSSNPNVTVVPPSPHTSDLSFGDQQSNKSAVKIDAAANGSLSSSTTRRVHSLSVGNQSPSSPATSPEEDPMTPTPWSRPAAPDRSTTVRPLSQSNSAGDLRSLGQQGSPLRASTVAPAGHLEEPTPRKRTISQKSSRSALRVKIDNNASSTTTNDQAATIAAPITTSPSELTSGAETASIIVDSPTHINTDFGPIKPIAPSATMPSVTSSSLLVPDNSDSVSVYSVGGTKKRRPWHRSSAKEKEREASMPSLSTSSTFSTSTSPKSKRKASAANGLASALAASGLAMANPGAIMQPMPISENSTTSTARATRSNSMASGTVSPGHSVTSASHRRRTSNDTPKTPPPHSSRSRQTSISYATSDISDRASFYSGDEGEDMGSGSEGEDLDDLDLDADDIPVTGFAVASARRNQEFHEMFSNIPEGDYLIEDYGCALQREILIQGRLYISENHVCFHANIFGWVTDLCIPMHEVIQLEKRMTAFVIPNAIQIITRTAKYTFTSFLSRDTTFDVMYNVWRLARPEGDSTSVLVAPSGLNGDAIRESVGDMNGAVLNGKKGNEVLVAARMNKFTQCACGRAGQHFSEIAMESILPGTPEKIYNLMFTSGFIKEFMRSDQKLLVLLFRNMSYIKPLTASIGPKQTKCEIHDEMVHCDFEDYVVMMATTRTPDVPSGGVFSVKTRTCLTWASSISTKVVVSTQVEWTGRSFIKGIIEKSCIDGQKTYHADLERAMRDYIHQHQSEFIPEGIDVAVVEEAEAQAEAPKTPLIGERLPLSEEARLREQERNLRGLQWAYDTFEGAFKVAQQSTEGALELIRDAWDQSTTSTILYFVIVILVISNIWTLAMMGKREEVGRRKELKRTEEREQWVQGIVTALWDELNGNKIPVAGGSPIVRSSTATGWREEIAELTLALDIVEDRVNRLRQSISNIES
ncbi:unnamed protein product [Somion occarium]|uniref:VASt domain-containing protein n=1 Tax=Somion occarium TaxID=3059160 RepID=A0ABP1CJH9_9APHY